MVTPIKPNTHNAALVPKKLLRKEVVLGTADCCIAVVDVGAILVEVGGGIILESCTVSGLTLGGRIAGTRRLLFEAISFLKV